MCVCLGHHQMKTSLTREFASYLDALPSEVDPAEICSQFLHHCTFPRMLMTPEDALMAAKFAQLMHSLKHKRWFSM